MVAFKYKVLEPFRSKMNLKEIITDMQRPFFIMDIYNVYFCISKEYGKLLPLEIPDCILKSDFEVLHKFVEIYEIIEKIPLTIKDCSSIKDLEYFYNSVPLSYALLNAFEEKAIALGQEQDPLITAFDEKMFTDDPLMCLLDI